MGVSPWFRKSKLIPGFGRSEANREKEVPPKRVNGNFSLRIHVFLNRIVDIENIKLTPILTASVFTHDLCFHLMI